MPNATAVEEFLGEPFENTAQFYPHLALAPSTIAVLYVGLPVEDGLSICRHLRKHDGEMGIVFVTTRGLREHHLRSKGERAAGLTLPVRAVCGVGYC